MKKVIALLLAMLMTLSLAGCGQSAESKAADALISAIGDVSLDSKTAIEAAEEAVAALTDEDRKTLKNGQLLTDAREKLEGLIAEDEAENIMSAIDDIRDVTLDSGERLDAVRRLYESAAANVKKLVTNSDKLVEAEEKLVELRAGVVEKLISAIGEVSPESGEAIAAARKAYDELTDEVKAAVKNSEQLKTAEDKYAELRAAAASALIDAIGEISADSEPAIEAAKAAFKDLSDKEKALVENAAVLDTADELLDAARKARADALLAKMTKDEDKVRSMSFYYPSAWSFYGSGSWAADQRCFVLPYIGRDSSSTWLRIVYNYTAYDWIFFEKVIVAADDERFTKNFDYFDVTRDNSGERVWEYMDDNAGASDVEMLWAIANSTETIVRFEGDDYYHDFTVKDSDKQAIRDALTVYEAYN